MSSCAGPLPDSLAMAPGLRSVCTGAFVTPLATASTAAVDEQPVAAPDVTAGALPHPVQVVRGEQIKCRTRNLGGHAFERIRAGRPVPDQSSMVSYDPTRAGG